MGTVLYYFTSTGNSLAIARQLAGKLQGCEIRSMVTEDPLQSVGGPGESVGFVFPVYYYGLPGLVKRFAEKLNIRKSTYCFAVADSGGSKTDTLRMLRSILRKKGLELAFADEVAMPGNYIVNYPAIDPEKIRTRLKEAAGRIERDAAMIASGASLPPERNAVLLSRIASRYFLSHMAGWDSKFTVSADCSGCGLCTKVCPVGNIRMESGRPVWLHRCEHCLACIQWCPCEAIHYGEKTAGRKRYHHPDISAADIVWANHASRSEVKMEACHADGES